MKNDQDTQKTGAELIRELTEAKDEQVVHCDVLRKKYWFYQIICIAFLVSAVLLPFSPSIFAWPAFGLSLMMFLWTFRMRNLSKSDYEINYGLSKFSEKYRDMVKNETYGR
jgi:uncharacterized membrane protein